jgi:hypothetical protein
MRGLIASLAVGAVVYATLGCGGGDTSGGDGGSDSDSGRPRDSGSETESASDSGGGTACLLSAMFVCQKDVPTADYGTSEIESSCIADKGTVMVSCPTAKLVGCCTDNGEMTTEVCSYVGSDRGTATSQATFCMEAGGNWSTTP